MFEITSVDCNCLNERWKTPTVYKSGQSNFLVYRTKSVVKLIIFVFSFVVKDEFPNSNFWVSKESVLPNKCEKVKHESRVVSYEFRYTSYKFKSATYEFKSKSYEFKSKSHEFKSTSYELKSTIQENKSTSCKIKSTSWEIKSTSTIWSNKTTT